MSTEAIPSIRALARAIGRSHTAVAKWARHPEWPWSQRGPWPASLVPKIKAWAVDTLKEDHAAAERWTDKDLAALGLECPDLLDPRELLRVNEFLGGAPLTTRTAVRAEAARLRKLADETEAALAAEAQEQ